MFLPFTYVNIVSKFIFIISISSGQAAAPDFESSSYGTMLYFLEGVLPFLTSFYQYFYYPERASHPNELDETDHIAKAVVVSMLPISEINITLNCFFTCLKVSFLINQYLKACSFSILGCFNSSLCIFRNFCLECKIFFIRRYLKYYIDWKQSHRKCISLF